MTPADRQRRLSEPSEDETVEDGWIRCPYCDYLMVDDLYGVADGDVIECDSCGGSMVVAVDTTVTYTARRVAP